MSAVADNLATLRAYPLTSPGSVAQENVTKLRRLNPDDLVFEGQRIYIGASIGAEAEIIINDPLTITGWTN